nr:MBL fold metallo-hydrolase [Kordiimonas marina]
MPSPAVAQRLRHDARYGLAEQVAPGVLRVLADNAKDYTGAGTNTYIVGDDSVMIIDPGPDCPAHMAAVMRAVGTRPITGIFVTHTHQDHSPAARALKAVTGARTYGFGALSPDILALTDEDVDPDFEPDERLADGHCVGDGMWRLTALHTPGHFPNHLCYQLAHQGLLFSGDHVMGWSTTVVVPPLGNLADYMMSLGKLEAESARLMLPSHGPEVADPTGRIQAVRAHRLMRHDQIIDCLRRGIRDVDAIVAEIYVGLTPRLIDAAKGCVRAHLELIEKGGAAGEKPAYPVSRPNAPSATA